MMVGKSINIFYMLNKSLSAHEKQLHDLGLSMFSFRAIVYLLISSKIISSIILSNSES